MATEVKQVKQDQKLTVEEYRSRLQDEEHNKSLVAVMEYVYGLNYHLLSKGVLSEEEMEILDSLKKIQSKVNAELIKTIVGKDDAEIYENFMKALLITYQEHLELYIRKDGKFNPGEENRPLSENERSWLSRHFAFLVAHLSDCIGKVLDDMFAQDWISESHKRRISEEKHADERVATLLRVVRSRSFQHYKYFLTYLPDLVPAFQPSQFSVECNSAVAALDVHVRSNTEDVDKSILEKEIIEQHRTIKYQRVIEQIDQANKTWDVGLLKKNSIRIYLSCDSLQSLHDIRSAVQSGEMKKFLELLFNGLLDATATASVTHLFLVDFSFQEFSLQLAAADSKRKHEILRNGAEMMKKAFHKDPLKKAKEKLLFCAYMLREANDKEVSSRPEREAFVQLSSVCRAWWTALKRPAFKTILNNRLKQPDGRINLKRQARIQFRDPVVCATQLHDSIYVVLSSETNTLQQYSVKYTEFVDKFVVADNIRISSVEASESDNGIFCVDGTDGAVSLWTKGQQTPAAVFKQFSRCRCIAVSSKDNMRVLLLAEINAVELHDQHSKTIEILHLPRHIENPLWIVRNDGGNILISHGSNTGNRHQICMMKSSGKIALTYGGECGKGPDELNRPCCMTLDEMDRVFVADSNNHRVLVLDKKMSMINVILDEKYDRIGSPSSLYYVRDSKQLLVTYENYLNVYKVKVRDGTAQSNEQAEVEKAEIFSDTYEYVKKSELSLTH